MNIIICNSGVVDHIETIKSEADAGNVIKGEECYGGVFPENCDAFYGPHSVDCLITIWEEVDCKVEGYRYPNNLTIADADALKNLNLTAVEENMESVKSAADGGNVDHQLNCYGLVFPENCDAYYGPHSVECLTDIWESKGCLSEGTRAPVKLTPSEKQNLDLLSLKDVEMKMETIRIEADGGDTDKELECYGIVYPENCDSYNGPHSIDCLITIWEEVDCKVMGWRYPGNLTSAEANTLKSLDLRAVRSNMEDVKSAADSGNADHQLNCYGIAFPDNCDTYYGPHSVECLTTIWESKGCLSEGSKAPVKLDTAEKEALDLLNVNDIEINFENTRIEADGGDKDKGMECYGLVYPANCDAFYGPHSIKCLITIWEEVDCKVEGYRYPGNLTAEDAGDLRNLDLTSIQENMESVKSAADGGNADHQLNCYGIVFPENCDTYYGPHSVECLTTIWESKGCLSEGSKAPVKLNTAEKEALDLLNVDDVSINFEIVRMEADNGDEDKGLECYGIGLYKKCLAVMFVFLIIYAVYPENCDSYHGPHSIDCLITIWEEVGCKLEGYKYPGNLTGAEAHSLRNMDILTIEENMRSVKLAADGGNTDHQLNCYGTVFPDNCDSYYGPYSVECLTTMWEWKGCLSEGTKAPVKLNLEEKDFLDLLNLNEVLDNFEMIRMEADGGDKDKGLECYGIVYPENCDSYHGPHSIDCLITIWEEVDCKVKGYRYPGNLTTADADALKSINLTAVRGNMESVKLAADGGNDDHQLNCYGFVFPENCDTYYGPHSVECLTTIWESKGCLSEGTKAPVKLDTDETSALDSLNVDEVLNNFEIVRMEADGGDKDKGLECYGIVYPENCTSYHGPHSIDCLITIWEEVDCKVKGYRYPGNLTMSEFDAMQKRNLRDITANMEAVKSAADGGNDDHQLNCYGLVFPENCATYYGPHSIECLTTIWESKGCLSEGTKAPVKLNTTEKDALDLLNVDEVLDNFELVQLEAVGGNKNKELECYGIAFPENCDSFFGPHSVECLITIWEEVDCKVEGFRHPNNLTTDDTHTLELMNLTAIKENMESVKSAADGGNDYHQLNCYGLVFPENCDTYHGEHIVECLTTIWLMKGCLSEGTKAPVKLDTAELHSVVVLNLHEVLNKFKLVQIKADGGDEDKELECYGLVFPNNCNSYHGRHSIECLITIWEEVGCKVEGYRYPNNLTATNSHTLEFRNLRAVRENMAGVKSAADDGNDDHQLNCYGLVFPDNCDTYYGPHSVECLTTIWEWKGCLSEGTKAAVKLNTSKTDALDLLNVDEVINNFETVRTEADNGDKDKELECYGLVFPKNCTSYHGLHTLECLITIWEEVDCKVKGYRYPGNLTSADAALQTLNLRHVRANMEGVKSAADAGNDDHQLNCYGLVFPENCTTFYGPHSMECFTNLWYINGCLVEGTKDPLKLDQEEKETLDSLTLDEILNNFETTRITAESGDEDKGMECYGIALPDNCVSYYGPHNLECLITIWEEVDCKVMGWRYPGNLTVSDADALRSSNLREIIQNMESVKSAADGGNDEDQLNCYGLGKFGHHFINLGCF
ncbi:uncharacterized protein LOC100175212 isoform X3 [Ciona intestinalis]